MKKLFLFALVTVFSFSMGHTQEDPLKMISKAKKALKAFNLEQTAKAASLDEAKTIIDDAFKAEIVQTNVEALLLKGDIYSSFLTRDQTAKLLDPNFKSKVDFPAAFIAYESYLKANELGVKKFEKADAIKGLQSISGALNNAGNDLYNAGDYEGAYKNFLASLNIHDKVKAAGQASSLDKPEDLNNQMFIVAASGVKAKKYNEVKEINEKLINANYNDGGIYENKYEILLSAGDNKGAEAALEEGRKKLPDDVGLIFKEINHYIRTGRLDALVNKLQDAIKKEPNNVSLYNTLGNVYDNLYGKDSMWIAKDDKGNYTVLLSVEKNENYKNAIVYFGKAAEMDSKNSDSQYGLGAFYYNVAARMTNILNKLADDYSKEGTKKYEAVKVEVFTMFDKSLPYFKKAESLNPNDRNTLIALKEIHARKNEFDLSNEYKKRLETVEAGGKNESSFNKN